MVIDVLRATTVIAHALANECSAVTPLLHVQDALEYRAAHPDTLIGGERKGRKLEGFDLGNSPSEYDRSVVGGKHVAITTTNGTAAIHHCRTHAAACVSTCALVNVSATAAMLLDGPCDTVHIVCAGTDGQVALEDVMCAGALIDMISRQRSYQHHHTHHPLSLDDQARIAHATWLQNRGIVYDKVAHTLRLAQGGVNVMDNNLEADIDVASAVDLFPNVACVLDETRGCFVKRHVKV